MDRFGPLPDEASFLLWISKTRAVLTNSSVKKLVLRKNSLCFTVTSFHPFKSLAAFISAVLNHFKTTEKSLSLKDNKDNSMSVSIDGVRVGYSSIKNIYRLLESLFLK